MKAFILLIAVASASKVTLEQKCAEAKQATHAKYVFVTPFDSFETAGGISDCNDGKCLPDADSGCDNVFANFAPGLSPGADRAAIDALTKPPTDPKKMAYNGINVRLQVLHAQFYLPDLLKEKITFMATTDLIGFKANGATLLAAGDLLQALFVNVQADGFDIKVFADWKDNAKLHLVFDKGPAAAYPGYSLFIGSPSKISHISSTMPACAAPEITDEDFKKLFDITESEGTESFDEAFPDSDLILE